MKNASGRTGIAAICLLASSIAVTMTGCSLEGASDAFFEKEMVAASAQQNKSLPMMVDKDTRWDTTIPGPGKNWTYVYTLVSPELKNITNKEINDALGEKIRVGVCTMKEMQVFIDKGVKITYKYRNSEGGFIGEVVVTPEDCKKIPGGAKKPV